MNQNQAKQNDNCLPLRRQACTEKGGVYLNSVYSEIEKICKDCLSKPAEGLPDRYTVLYREPDGLKTAYCFSVPIRNIRNNTMIDLKFRHHGQYSSFDGSNCKIIISDKIKIMNDHGQCDIPMPCNLHKRTDTAIFFKDDTGGEIEIRPTLNGIILLFDSRLSPDRKKITLRCNRAFEGTRTNNKYFCVMREKFIPFLTVSCIGLMNAREKINAPCEVFPQQSGNGEYILNFSGNGSQNRIAIEINMQEPKLFQDTTVESMHPTVNNAFGGTSFLGPSKMFGEQWLYTRLEISNLAYLQDKKIRKSILHIPCLGYNVSPITVSKTAVRFCSFGTNWENKIAVTERTAQSLASFGYYHLDITTLLGNFNNRAENFVIRGTDQRKPVIIPTGDSFYTPQILEVRYQ